MRERARDREEVKTSITVGLRVPAKVATVARDTGVARAARAMLPDAL